jgi:amino acid transporter
VYVTTPSLPPVDPAGDPAAIHLPPERRISMFSLACLVFFTTCGGAFGLESLIGAVGPAWAVLFILVTPFVWSLPTALMVAELATLLPEEGGYYVWVREALGPAWGVQQACCTITTAIVWLAMYPVLFVSYLAFFFPSLNTSSHGALLRWLVCVLVVASGMTLNLRGARDVGNSAMASTYFVLGVFVLFLIVWFARIPSAGAFVGILHNDFAAEHRGALLLGLSVVIFNYSGWDNVSTYAGEVDQPQRNYPRAMAIALLTLVISYLLPVIAGITITTKPEIWSSDAGWPVISQLIGGRWLGLTVAAAGLVSIWGLFNGQLLYVSRLPYALAIDGWLPQVFARVSPRTGAPRIAIFCFCAVAALFSALTFGNLAIIQCLLYSIALTLEFLSLVTLRLRHPKANRSFRVPGGWWGLAYVCVTPFAFASLVLYATLRDWRSYPGQLLVVPAVATVGLAIYLLRRKVACRYIRKSLAAESR